MAMKKGLGRGLDMLIPKEEKKEAQIKWNLIIEGIKYTMIYFGNKANLIDKTGALLFEEWRDLSSIYMCQDIPLVKDLDNKWTIFD